MKLERAIGKAESVHRKQSTSEGASFYVVNFDSSYAGKADVIMFRWVSSAAN